jgi:hypothetical protein
MVMLRSVSPRLNRVVRLLVVPPEWEEPAARYAMRAATNLSNTVSGSTILDESLELLLADLSPFGDDRRVGPRMSAAGPLR